MGSDSARSWQPDADVDDQVLVGRVVRSGLQTRRSLLQRLLRASGRRADGGLGTGTGGRLFTGPAADTLGHSQRSALGNDPAAGGMDRRTAALQLAAVELTNRLTDSERAQLRQTGELPDWFDSELKMKTKEKLKQRPRY